VAEFQQADACVVEKKIILCGKGRRATRFWKLLHAEGFLAEPKLVDAAQYLYTGRFDQD
jgi:hypothetical protein